MLARSDGRRMVTPLFVALFAIELTDIIFAVDSVPAALAISPSRFVVYSYRARVSAASGRRRRGR